MPVELESTDHQHNLSTDEKVKAIARVILDMTQTLFRDRGDEGDYWRHIEYEKRLKALYKDL